MQKTHKSQCLQGFHDRRHTKSPKKRRFFLPHLPDAQDSGLAAPYISTVQGPRFACCVIILLTQIAPASRKSMMQVRLSWTTVQGTRNLRAPRSQQRASLTKLHQVDRLLQIHQPSFGPPSAPTPRPFNSSIDPARRLGEYPAPEALCLGVSLGVLLG